MISLFLIFALVLPGGTKACIMMQKLGANLMKHYFLR